MTFRYTSWITKGRGTRDQMSIPGRSRGKRDFFAATPERPRVSFFNASRGPSPLPCPCGSAGKEPACNAGDLGSIPGLGKSPWRRERLPTSVFWPREFHGLYSPWSRPEGTLAPVSRAMLGLARLGTGFSMQVLESGWAWVPTV